MQYFPLFVDTNNINVLVVGAGDVAARKLALLTRTQANITVIADKVCDEVHEFVKAERISLTQRLVQDCDIEGIQLLYMATADNQINTKYAAVAKQKGIWVNVVDSSKDCSFITPAIVDRGKLQIAISSSGAAPVVAGLIRTKIESWLPQSASQLMDFASKTRNTLKQKLKAGLSLRQFWYQFFNLNGFEFTQNTQHIFNQTISQINHAANSGCQRVYFIKSTQNISQLPISVLPILQQVDRVYSDSEIPCELNELIRRDASRNKIKPTFFSEISEGIILIYANHCEVPSAIHLGTVP